MYCDYFEVDLEVIFVSLNRNSLNCGVRVTLGVNFLKSTIFENKIYTNTISGATDYWKEWV